MQEKITKEAFEFLSQNAGICQKTGKGEPIWMYLPYWIKVIDAENYIVEYFSYEKLPKELTEWLSQIQGRGKTPVEVELSELQEKYNKLRSAFENLLNRSIDHIEINPLTEKSKFELKQRLLSEAGLKEQ